MSGETDSPAVPRLAIDPALAGVVRVGVLTYDDVIVAPESSALAREVEESCRDLQARYGGTTSAAVPGVQEARSLYKALGIDPTKTRPSNEALLRRVLKGAGLYTVNTLVDAVNLAALRFQLPYGLYDVDRLTPPLVLRKGAPDEAYEGIRKGVVHLAGRPLIADRHGPFGNPTSDSARTMITSSTRRALVVLYAPGGWDSRRVSAILDGTADIFDRHSGGRVSGRGLIPD